MLSELEGLITEDVGEYLAHLGSLVPAHRVIVEVGSYKGKSACYLASQAVAHVYAVDPWDTPGNIGGRFGYDQAATRETFNRQVALMGYEQRISPIQGFGAAVGRAWEGPPVGLLYVDGDHTEGAVMADVMAWLPHVEGTVVLDDWGTPKNPGVKRAADRLVKRLGHYTVEAGRLAVWKP